MRIISGKYKSRRIYSVMSDRVGFNRGEDSYALRPTSDRAKETLFNILANRISFEGITCLDLFSGTGSLGFECLSRGAASCHFVDSSRNSFDVITRTAALLGCPEQVIFSREDVMRFLKENCNNYYDLILADPPYTYGGYSELIRMVMKMDFSIFVLEYREGTELKFESSGGIEILDRKIGLTRFKIFISEQI